MTASNHSKRRTGGDLAGIRVVSAARLPPWKAAPDEDNVLGTRIVLAKTCLIHGLITSCRETIPGVSAAYRTLDSLVRWLRRRQQGGNNLNYDEMVYHRPPTIPYPTIWRRFTVQRGSTTHKLRIQDLTPEFEERSIQLLAKYFTRDEPPCKYVGVQNNPAALTELEKLWRKTVADQVSLVCLEDKEEPEIVGVNVLCVASKDDKDEPFESDIKAWAKLYGAVDLVTRSVNIFEKYGVDKYLTAYGLVVDPKWRGCKIGKEILEARIPLCKALGIKVTATVFTAAASQAVAKKAGFEDLYEITYEELAQKGFVFPGIEKDTKSSKLMALAIE